MCHHPSCACSRFNVLQQAVRDTRQPNQLAAKYYGKLGLSIYNALKANRQVRPACPEELSCTCCWRMCGGAAASVLLALNARFSPLCQEAMTTNPRPTLLNAVPCCAAGACCLLCDCRALRPMRRL